jgi:ectoine hydroxylase
MLSAEQVHTFRDEGFLVDVCRFTPDEIALLKEHAEASFARRSPSRVVEKDGTTVRGVHGDHLVDDVLGRLVRMPQLVAPAEELLGGEVYVHQFKINAKKALHGDAWPWHQDYIFWNRRDGMREPKALNVAIMLDEATDINGPLLVLPGSQHRGMLDLSRGSGRVEGDGDWETQLSVDLDYAIDAALLAELSADREIRSVTAKAGAVCLFDPLIVHGSGTNMSPLDRNMILITYNLASNKPVQHGPARPEFLSARDVRPIRPLAWGEPLVPHA